MATIREVQVGVEVRVRPAAEIKAEALREAADDLYGDDGPQHPLSAAQWLRRRADRLDGRTSEADGFECDNPDHMGLCMPGHIRKDHVTDEKASNKP